MGIADVTETHLARVELGTLQASRPAEVLAGAASIATPLADLIEKRKLYSMISGRRYVGVDGWTAMAAMLGIVAREVGVVERENGVFEARVQFVRLSDGAVITEASHQCGGADDPVWAKRPGYARRSMAATRATGKAARLGFSWIMVMAGYEPTPAEEMPHEDEPRQPETAKATPKVEAKPVSKPRPVAVPKPAPEEPPDFELNPGGDDRPFDQELPVRVLEVTEKPGVSKAGKPYKMWRIRLSDGRDASTFDTGFKAIAEQAIRDDALVIATIEERDGYRNVVEMRIVT